jgi:cyclopropane-fatty-acyl-phospholipid synthase
MLQDKIIGALERRLRERNLPIRVRFWNGHEVAGADEARVALHLRSPGELELLAKPTLGKVAEHYVNQRIDIDGDIHDVIRLLPELFGNEPPPPAKPAPRFAPRLWRRRHTREADKQNIAFHYDVSNEFYALWLDARRVYSCAYFRNDDDTLDRAQEQKLDHICRKLDLKPGERFLDIGCGWGGLLLWAVEHYGVHGTGITLSRNQLEHVQAIIRERGLEDRCTVRLLDYRDVPADPPFDKISSVGMFEHVGVANLPIYFAKIHSLLRPGGLAMNHGITSTRLDGSSGISGSSEFIERYVFPEGELSHVSTVIQEISRQGLEVRDVESLRPHYAKTLWHWVHRLEAKADEARRIVGETRFRVWRTYMAGSAFGFESNFMSIYQILAGRPLPDGTLPVPLTREYMYPQ